MRIIAGVRSRQGQEESHHEDHGYASEPMSGPNEEPGQDSTMQDEAGGGRYERTAFQINQKA